MKRCLATVLAVAVLSGSTCFGRNETAPFPYVKTLSAAEDQSATIGIFQLDGEILAQTVRDYANLRIIDEFGREARYLVRHRMGDTPDTEHKPVRFDTSNVSIREDGRMEMFLIRDPNAFNRPVSLLRFNTHEKNYEKELDVYSSSDGTNWKLVVPGARIYDFSRHIDFKSTEVTLPGIRDPHLKVVVSGITEQTQSPFREYIRETRAGEEIRSVEKHSINRRDFRIDTLCLYETVPVRTRRALETIEYPASEIQISEDPSTKSTILMFRAHSAPVEHIEILTHTPNFLRQATVEVSERDTGTDRWIVAGQAILSQIQGSTQNPGNQRIHLPAANRHDRYRIRIYNRDSPPLNIEGVRLTGPVVDAVFFCAPKTSYSVFYGASNIPLPEYDINAALRPGDPVTMTRFTLGSARRNPDYTLESRRFPVKGRTVMMFTIILMAVVLGGLIFRTVRALDS